MAGVEQRTPSYLLCCRRARQAVCGGYTGRPPCAGGNARDDALPKTSDGVHIAYQVLGEGPYDFVYVGPRVTHLEYRCELPRYPPTFDGSRVPDKRRALATDSH